MSKFRKKFNAFIKNKDKKVFRVYTILRLLVILTLVIQLIHGNYHEVFLCILTLILFIIPYIIDDKFKITLPNALEISIFLFIFSAEILGEIQNFYGIFPHWDTILHTINGFLSAAIGFSLVDILNNSKKITFSLSPFFVVIVAFTFSMTVGACWEIFEFSGDQLLNMDMQKDRIVDKISSVELNKEKKNVPVIITDIDHIDIHYTENQEDKLMTINGYLDIGIIDTMKDLIVNLIGASVFSVYGYLYLKNKDKYKKIENYIAKKKITNQ